MFRGFKQRLHMQLRKYRVGRRLCVTKKGNKKGCVVLVPAGSLVSDEI
jgi:hypothetical protein